jgi:hypothetical protein
MRDESIAVNRTESKGRALKTRSGWARFSLDKNPSQSSAEGYLENSLRV